MNPIQIIYIVATEHRIPPSVKVRFYKGPLVTKSMRSRDTDLEPLNILVFGPTGAGKTTIINYLTSGQLPVGHSLESCTREVQVACTKHQGRLVNY
ncbi:hypothetical protein RSAG8_12932, partial [Rhizoctonia solani AG-8 WAC10335]